MRFFGRSLLGLVLLAVTLGLLAAAAATVRSAIEARLAGGAAAPPARERVFSANVVTARAETVTPAMTVFGEIRSRRTLELRSPRAGTVLDLADPFEDGAAVRAGQVLWRLDPADATSARDLARSDLRQREGEAREAARALELARDDLAAAQAQAALRAQALARQQDLRGRGVGSEAAVETAALALSASDQAVVSRRAALAQAESRVEQAATALDRQRITVAEAERALRETEMRAEFDGVLNAVSVVRGRILSSNERVGELIDPTSLEVAIRLSTAQFVRLVDETGELRQTAVTVTLDVSGAEIVSPGTLTRAGAAVGEGQTGRQVFAALAAGGGFRPGDFVSVRIDEAALDGAIALPATALGSDGAVLALGPEDRLETVPVTLLRRQDDLVIVSAAELDGREVVAERSPLLGSGIRIRPMRPDTAGGAAAQAAADLVDLTSERRAALVALVEGNARMSAEAKARVLAQLAQDRVPAALVSRLEARGGG
ncbi:MAG: HlyD family efflux transporter periplasmic adaptor subunit [Paracoccaceae bacterium]|nr:MAG: HlyD family efflux transporter periplasmic adaptor subunit [Paracoccaceae bacterium]